MKQEINKGDYFEYNYIYGKYKGLVKVISISEISIIYTVIHLNKQSRIDEQSSGLAGCIFFNTNAIKIPKEIVESEGYQLLLKLGNNMKEVENIYIGDYFRYHGIDDYVTGIIKITDILSNLVSYDIIYCDKSVKKTMSRRVFKNFLIRNEKKIPKNIAESEGYRLLLKLG